MAYTHFVAVSVDEPETLPAFRAGLGARWTFLSDAYRRYQTELGLRETTDPLHRLYVPTVFTLFRDFVIHPVCDGYWTTGTALPCAWTPTSPTPRPTRRGCPWC